MWIHLNKQLSFFTVLATVIQAAFGQSPAVKRPPANLTLEQAWAKAEQYNKAIQMQHLHVQSKAEDIEDAKAERLPDINIAGEYDYVSNLPMYENGIFNKPTQFPVLHTYYRLGGDTYFNLYNGRKTTLKISEQETEYQIRREQRNLTAAEIKLRASSYYLDLQRNGIFRQLMITNIYEQEKQLVQIRQLQKNGVVLKSDVLSAQLQLSRQRLSLTQIENDMAIANQKLNIVIGQPDSTLNVPAPLPDLDSASVRSYPDYLADAMQHAHENKISEQETNLRRLQVKDVKANVSPRLGVFANYAYTYPQIQFYPYNAALYGLGMIGLRASFPISAYYYNKHKAKASELEFKRQEIEHLDVQDNIRQQVNEAYLRYKEALNRVSVARTNISQASENFRIINNTYFNQLSLVTDLLEANTQLLQTQFELTAAQIAARMQYYQLQKVIGNL
jgi:outer membrane protein